MQIPPGLAYASHRLPRLLVPPGLVYAANRATQAYFNIHLAPWVVVLASVLSLPAALVLAVRYADYVNQREAAAQGAVLPPQVKDGWPGGLTLLAVMIDNFKRGYPGEMISGWAKTHGDTFNLRILFENRIFTSEPEYIKAMLATQFDSFGKGPQFFFQYHSLLGTGVFNSDGDMWKFHRGMTRPFFTKDRITHFDIFERHADDAIEQLKTRLKEGHPVDIQDVASRFTLDSASDFLFGKDVRSLSAGLPYPFYSPLAQSSSALSHPANVFARAFGAAQSVSTRRSRWGNNWPLAEFWRDTAKGHMAVVDQFIDPILADAVAKKRAARESGEEPLKQVGDREVKEGETLLDHLVNYTDDKKVLKDEILNITVAGRDTTANTITFTIYMLAEHPDVLRRLRKEILEHVGNSRRPDYDDLREMKYLRAVINETLRLYPAVPFNVRTTNRATVWPAVNGGKPFYIPANTRCPYSVFLMHRREDLWGPDALQFDPDRFLDDRLHKYLTPNPFIFLPFNAGPRICLGQQFAYHETSFFIVRLLQRFSTIALAPAAQPPHSRPPLSWANAPETRNEKIWPKSHLTMYALDGVWLTMEEASANEDTLKLQVV